MHETPHANADAAVVVGSAGEAAVDAPTPRESYPPAPDTTLRSTVGDAFNIHQATVSILSILLGFVFAGLLQILGDDGPLSAWAVRVAWGLIGANIALFAALLLFHYTANQVVRYWRIFLPASHARTWAAWLIVIGMAMMQATIALLLWARGMKAACAIIACTIIGLLVFNRHFASMHRDATYVRRVD